MAFLFVAYPKCSTCKAAQRFLEDHQMDYALRDITRDVPTAAELDAWQQKSGLPLRAFFNTSGLRYRALGLKDSLADMPRQAQLALLASDGMLIKRPILVGAQQVLVGFRPAQWEEAR